MKIMSVTPNNNKSGSKEMKKYCLLAEQAEVDVVLFPSSFLPYYKNQSAFYTEQDTAKLPDKLSQIIKSNLIIIVGINAKMVTSKLHKQVVSFNRKKILHSHLKRDLEKHYIEKGFIPGKGMDLSFVYNKIKINTLECYEVLFDKNYKNANIITGSIGFGMRAKTKHYDCDYFDQWLTIIKANCLCNRCYAVLSCNGQHEDSMTVAINQEGEIIGMARKPGHFTIEINPKKFRKNKNPFAQEQE